MEIKNVTKEKPIKFEPITIELTINTMEELAYLCAAFNCSIGTLASSGATDPFVEVEGHNQYPQKTEIYAFFSSLYKERKKEMNK